MFGKKKEDSLPDLSPSRHEFTPPIIHTEPSEPDHDNLVHESHSLPTFPDSPNQKGFAQTAIKDAVSTEEHHTMELPETSHETTQHFKTQELTEWSPHTPEEPESMPEPPSFSATPVSLTTDSAKAGIFVKLNKFNLAKKSLNDVAQKLSEIDDLLKNIKSTRSKEEEELSSWEQELNSVKARVQDVTQDVFEDVEWVQNS